MAAMACPSAERQDAVAQLFMVDSRQLLLAFLVKADAIAPAVSVLTTDIGTTICVFESFQHSRGCRHKPHIKQQSVEPIVHCPDQSPDA